ncbi:hypothetical protein IEQ34_010503 [Dendrobium chrysotoxum]|uniref:Uncharacterized protein n=1 Tax=Dendrobium chrysotoxum TaxID=161865 RepID=A0AAV7GDK8_DENCH|nr:hypothetical protein IEQ34_010503 [Dendrobium chrysotoxum]
MGSRAYLLLIRINKNVEKRITNNKDDTLKEDNIRKHSYVGDQLDCGLTERKALTQREKAFQLDEKTVDILQAKFWMNND